MATLLRRLQTYLKLNSDNITNPKDGYIYDTPGGIQVGGRALLTGTSNSDGSLTLSEASAGAVYVPDADLRRAAARMAIKKSTLAEIIRGIFFGDSWGAGAAATNAYGFAQQIAGEVTDVQWSNYSYPSRPIGAYHFAPRQSGADISAGGSALNIQIRRTDVSIGIPGLNDLRGATTNGQSNFACGSNPLSRKTLISRLQAYATRMMVPESETVRMHVVGTTTPNPAVTFANGTWDHTTGINGNTNCSKSNTPGSTATLTTPAGNLLGVRFMSGTASTGVWSLTVDGVSYGNFLNKAGFDDWVTDGIIVQLPTKSAHTVVLKHESGDWFMPEAVWCVDTTTDFSAFLLYSAPAPASPAGWAITPTMNSARANARAVVNAASVSGTTLTISSASSEAAITSGQVSPGQIVFAQTSGDGAVIPTGAVIGEQLTKTGAKGSGTYRLHGADTGVTNGTFTNLVLVNPGAAAMFENAGRDRFAAWVVEAMNELYRMGFNVINTWATEGWDYLTFETPSNEIHANDMGHGRLKRRFKAPVNVLLGRVA